MSHFILFYVQSNPMMVNNFKVVENKYDASSKKSSKSVAVS